MSVIEIPLSRGAQKFTIRLGDKLFRFRLIYRKAVGGGWFLDMTDVSTGDGINGIPLVKNTDLLEQYQYKGFGHLVMLFEHTEREEPGFEDVGKAVRLYWTDEETA